MDEEPTGRRAVHNHVVGYHLIIEAAGLSRISIEL